MAIFALAMAGAEMKVKELIESLQQLPPDAIVAITTDLEVPKTIHSISSLVESPYILGGMAIIVGEPD